MTASAILVAHEPCKKCGSVERMKNNRCAECNRRAASLWYANNKERAKANGMAYRAANPDKHAMAVAAVVRADPDKKRAHDAAWHAKNRERVKARKAAWYEANPDARNLYHHNRRARKLERGGTLSAGLRARLFELQQGKCACCGEPLGAVPHLDHRMPLVLGGTNTDDNMQLLRKECNLKKGARHPVDYMQSRGYLI